MDATELNEVCRLCPSSGGGDDLMHVFDERLSVKNNMKEVISVTTGVQIQETDLISKKICQRCCTKTLQMFLFRQDALTQDRALKEKCTRFLDDKGIRLPNTCITIKRERRDSCVSIKRPKVEVNEILPTNVKIKRKKVLHPSIADIYKNYPRIKLPKKCLERHLAPVVSFAMGEVEEYFRKCKLDMRSFIWRPDSKKKPSIAVAKKRTSFPTKRKTVSPIKISKKVLEVHELQNSSTNVDYVCTSVYKDRDRNRSISSSDVDKRSSSKMLNENKTKSLPFCSKSIKLPNVSDTNVPEVQIPILPPPVSVPQTPKTVRAVTPTAVDPISEDSRESSSSATSKPEFIESLGLTPTVTATKSKTLHVCNLCGSVHNNAFKLKTHTRKHMVCQFCKLRFKSLETKQDHVDNSCQVKKIMNSPGPVVELEKVHLNLDVRKTFRDTFSGFETIPGLPESDSMEDVPVKAESSLSRLDTDVVILLSDDETQTRSSDPPSSAATSTSDVLPKSVNLLYSTVSEVKPDVRIKNDLVLNSIVDNVGDRQIVKDLLEFLKTRRRIRTVDKVLQTDLPATKDIKINNAEGFCEFKNLKEQLSFFNIPVSITDGPFHVGYQYKNNSKAAKTMALWDDLPILDVRTSQQNERVTPNNSLLPTNSPLPVMNSQVQSAHVSSSVPPSITNNVPGLAAIQNNSFSVLPDANISTSATPLLQKFAQSTTPTKIINKPVPIPKVFVKSALGYAASKRRSLSSGGKTAVNRPVPTSTLSRKSLPSNVSKSGETNSIALNRSSSLVSLKGTATPGSITTGAQPSCNSSTSTGVQSKTDSLSTSASENSRFRVKHVWELQ